MLQKLDAWHKSRYGYLLFAVLELAIAYGFASLSIDRGNLWWYLLTILFLIGALQNLFKFSATFFRRDRRGRR